MFVKVDCIQVHVPNLDDGMAFYCDRLGHEVLWRTDTQVGLAMSGADTELVLQSERGGIEVDLMVRDADEAASVFERSGGSIVQSPFEVQIGRAAVVADPWGNRVVLIDMRKGPIT